MHSREPDKEETTKQYPLVSYDSLDHGKSTGTQKTKKYKNLYRLPGFGNPRSGGFLNWFIASEFLRRIFWGKVRCRKALRDGEGAVGVIFLLSGRACTSLSLRDRQAQGRTNLFLGRARGIFFCEMPYSVSATRKGLTLKRFTGNAKMGVPDGDLIGSVL